MRAEDTPGPLVLAGILLAVGCGLYASRHLGVNTDTDQMSSASLPWRQRAMALDRAFELRHTVTSEPRHGQRLPPQRLGDAHLPPCRLLDPPCRRLQPFRRLHDCFGCFRLERIAEWALYPLKNTTFLGVRTSIDMIRWR